MKAKSFTQMKGFFLASPVAKWGETLDTSGMSRNEMNGFCEFLDGIVITLAQLSFYVNNRAGGRSHEQALQELESQTHRVKIAIGADFVADPSYGETADS